MNRSRHSRQAAHLVPGRRILVLKDVLAFPLTSLVVPTQAELEARLKDVAGFVGNMGGAGAVDDDSGELMTSLKDRIADIKSELEEMDDDA
jgi:hypothetical protein